MSSTSVYDQYQRLTQHEQRYIRSHPHHAIAIRDTRDAAFAETRKRFGLNGRNDKSDAFRHCYWSALLTREIGYVNALNFTTAHESAPSNAPAEKAMDLYNNGIGLNIGRSKGTNQGLSDRCYAALVAGKLRTLTK